MKKGIPYNQGKRHQNKQRKKYIKGLFAIFIIVVIIVILYIGQKFVIGNSAKSTNEETNSIKTTEIASNENIEQEAQAILSQSKQQETVEIDLPDKLGNYTVIGQLVIDKIGVKKEILNITNDASLNLSVTKFYGPNINEKGNFCITGHNYKNMLKEAKKLKKGDTFYLINKENKTKVTYKIFDIYTCNPKDLECLDSRYPGTKEVTLITCNPGGITRLIIKAKEA